MKKFFAFCSSLLIMGACVFTSCEKPETPQGGDEPTPGATPTVSISADQTYAEDNTATVTLTLSAAAEADVKVTLAKADPKDGITELVADYTKNVTIKAGETKATVTVTAETRGLEAGEYQTGIKIASATGAEVAENAVVYIKFVYEFKPSVSLYADANFSSDKTANLTVKLDKAGAKDVVVTLADGEGTVAAMTYDKTVTVPAGQTEVVVPVTVDVPADLTAGVYPGVITIVEVTNGLKGNVPSVTINLAYPFTVTITVDGVFDEWDNPTIQTWTLPEGQVLYDRIKVLKLTANEKYVYMYTEFQDSFDWPVSSNIYIDADGNHETGGIVTAAHNLTYDMPPYENMGLEWYLEHWIHDGAVYNNMYTWGTTYKYTSDTPGLGVFGNLTAQAVGSFGGETLFCTGSVDENGIARWEIQFDRAFFGMTGDAAEFAFKVYEYDNMYGLIPQGTASDLNDYKSRQHVPMARVNLPAFVQ